MNTNEITVRQHWMSMIKLGMVFFAILSLLSIWARFNIVSLVHFLHDTMHLEKQAFAAPVVGFYHHWALWALIPWIIIAIWVGLIYSTWSISYITIDAYGLNYKFGPFKQDIIPLRAIQHIDSEKGVFGLMFGYGTLIVDAGRGEERLQYVPNVNEMVLALRPRGY